MREDPDQAPKVTKQACGGGGLTGRMVKSPPFLQRSHWVTGSRRSPGSDNPSWMGVSPGVAMTQLALGPRRWRAPPEESRVSSPARLLRAARLDGSWGSEPAPSRRPRWGDTGCVRRGRGRRRPGHRAARTPPDAGPGPVCPAARRGLPTGSRAGVEGRLGPGPTPAPTPHLPSAPLSAGPATHSPRAPG